MYDSQMISDNDSIDFAFFGTEGDKIKLYESGKQSSCSKIVTKAVIESNSFDTKNIQNNQNRPKNPNELIIKSPIKQHNFGIINFENNEMNLSRENIFTNNSVKADVDTSLFNCLAYNDSLPTVKNAQTTSEDSEYSNNSPSDSTVTTITSDFTSISPISSLSNSSTISSLYEASTSSSNFKTDTQYNAAGDASNNEQSQNSSTQKDEEEGKNGNCNSSENDNSTGTGSNKDSSKFDENEEGLFETDDEAENMTNSDFNENSFCEEGVQKSEENTYSETWESVSESNDRPNSLNQESSENSDPAEYSEIPVALWDVENEMENISLKESQTESLFQETPSNSSLSNSGKILAYRKQERLKRKKGLNLTFSREELIKIERDNLILLKKIMSKSKPRTVSLNQPFNHKKTSTAINRAKQQKQIDQDNYILYSKISAMNRTKRVF